MYPRAPRSDDDPACRSSSDIFSACEAFSSTLDEHYRMPLAYRIATSSMASYWDIRDMVLGPSLSFMSILSVRSIASSSQMGLAGF